MKRALALLAVACGAAWALAQQQPYFEAFEVRLTGFHNIDLDPGK